MPLLELAPQLKSTCSWKSSNLASWMSSGPSPGVISAPSWTLQTEDELGLSILQPVRSFPLNNEMGFPHFENLLPVKAGALWPVHGHVLPSGPVVVPERTLPVSVPSKTMSSVRSSSSLGETNLRCPLESSTFGSGRAFPQRPTMRALRWPSSWRSSSQEGYSRSGAYSVKSQRPRNGLRDSSAPQGGMFPAFACRECPVNHESTASTGRTASLGSLIEPRVPSLAPRCCGPDQESGYGNRFLGALLLRTPVRLVKPILVQCARYAAWPCSHQS